MIIHKVSSTLSIHFLLVTTTLFQPSLSSCPITAPADRSFLDSQPTICVVGAGISGLNTATLLQQRGYFVEVFEKNPIVRGKAYSYREEPEIQVEMCPLVFTTGQDSVLEKIAEFNLTRVTFNQSARAGFNPNTGEVYPQMTLPPPEQQLLEDALNEYLSYREAHAADLAYGYLTTTPDLFVPMSEWLKNNNLEILTPVFVGIITVEGYGHLDDVPALYVLQFVDESLINGSVLGQYGVIFTLYEGSDILLKRMAEPLNVFLETEVIRVDRTQGDDPIITLSTGVTRICQSVILAFPPLLPNLEKLIPDLTSNEREVLDQVKIHKYISMADYIPALNFGLYSEVNPEGTGEVTGFITQSLLERKNMYSSYSWIRGDFNQVSTEEEVANMSRQLAETMQKMSVDSTNPETYFTHSTEYFPHVNSDSLNDGFYQKFDGIQGMNNVYYATTLLMFETLDRALKMTRGFADRYFPSQVHAADIPLSETV